MSQEQPSSIPENKTEEAIKNDGRSRLYWLQKNIRTRLWAWIKEHKVKGFLAIVTFLIFLFYMRAIIHPLALGIRKYFILVIVILFIIWLIRRWLRNKKLVTKIIGNLVLIGIVVLGYFYGKNVYRYIGLYYHYQTLNRQKIDQLPLTDQERIHPLNSIRVRLNQDGLPELAEATLPHIIIRKDGRLDFSMCIGPNTDYWWQRFTKNMTEVISVEANAYNTDYSKRNRTKVNFDVGENLVLSREASTAAIKKLNIIDYFNYEPDEVKYVEREPNDWVQVMTLIKWKGFLIPRPVFGGVIIFEQMDDTPPLVNFIKRASFGKGTFIAPKDIHKYDYLANQNLQSDYITQFTAESFRFQNGFFAPMPGYHNEDIRIPSFPQDQNQQPFVAYFDFKNIVPQLGGGLYHYFGLEPYQEDKRTLSTSVFIPSNGDDVVYYFDHVEHSDLFIGSSSVQYKIIDSKKNYDWSSYHPAETRPYIKMIDGRRQFYWLSTIVTKVDPEGKESFGGTNPELTITDAATGEVFWIQKKNLYKETDSSWVDQVRRHESY